MLQIKITELSSSSPNKTAKKYNLRIYKLLIKTRWSHKKQISQSYDISLLKLKLNYENHMKPKNEKKMTTKNQKKTTSLVVRKISLNWMLGFLISTLLSYTISQREAKNNQYCQKSIILSHYNEDTLAFQKLLSHGQYRTKMSRNKPNPSAYS